MKIEIEISEETEGTAEPWWMIVDPQQNFRTGADGACAVSQMITGPFFSRKEAEDVLQRTRYNYGKSALVWCASGCYTRQYREKYRAAERDPS